MPEWLWSIVVGVVVVGLVVALRKSDMSRTDNLEKWKTEKEAFDHKFRHDEYAPAITRINSELWPLINRVASLEKEVQGIKAWNESDVAGYMRAVDVLKERVDHLQLALKSRRT